MVKIHRNDSFWLNNASKAFGGRSLRSSFLHALSPSVANAFTPPIKRLTNKEIRAPQPWRSLRTGANSLPNIFSATDAVRKMEPRSALGQNGWTHHDSRSCELLSSSFWLIQVTAAAATNCSNYISDVTDAPCYSIYRSSSLPDTVCVRRTSWTFRHPTVGLVITADVTSDNSVQNFFRVSVLVRTYIPIYQRCRSVVGHCWSILFQLIVLYST